MNKDVEIRVLLVDDEAEIRGAVREMLVCHSEFRVVGEADGQAAALALLEKCPVQVVFSDIQMAGGSGFALAEAVHRNYPEVLVVFLTGYANFALDGYTYGPVDFLLKPVSRERFEQTLERIKERLNWRGGRNEPAHIGFQTDEGYRIMSVGEIAYLEKEERKVKIVGKDGSVTRTGRSMQELEEILLDYDFFRCHQSYLVPLGDIQEIRKERIGRAYRVRLHGCDTDLPLSRGKYYELMDMLQEKGLRRPGGQQQ